MPKNLCSRIWTDPESGSAHCNADLDSGSVLLKMSGYRSKNFSFRERVSLVCRLGLGFLGYPDRETMYKKSYL